MAVLENGSAPDLFDWAVQEIPDDLYPLTPDMAYVTAGQLALLIVAAGCSRSGMVLSVGAALERRPVPAPRRQGVPVRRRRLRASACWCGTRRRGGTGGRWRTTSTPSSGSGLLLALFVLYTQRIHPLRGLDWFVLPIVILLLAGAAVFGKTQPHEYRDTVWHWVHRVTSYGGAVAFAVAGAVGTMYLVTNRRLRTKRALPGPNLGSLERLEHLTLASVTLGFALLTVGTVTGLFGMVREDRTGADDQDRAGGGGVGGLRDRAALAHQPQLPRPQGGGAERRRFRADGRDAGGRAVHADAVNNEMNEDGGSEDRGW